LGWVNIFIHALQQSSSSTVFDCDQESRGAHYRSDFPKLDDEKWKVNIFCRKEGDEMTTFKEKVKEVKGTLVDFLKTHAKAEHQREFE
jgi:succinate dehydrogenase / fumarate reductase, flavoprotein subunit